MLLKFLLQGGAGYEGLEQHDGLQGRFTVESGLSLKTGKA